MQVSRFRAPDGLRYEEAHFDQFCRQTPGSSSMILWTQSQCLVTSSSVTRNTCFAQAAEKSAERGWAVHIRRSGGTTVFHSPAVLCATLMFDSPAVAPSVDAAYTVLVDVLLRALTDVGVSAAVGSAPGAPCDGRFNVVVEGRKLAGTAMRCRTVGARHCLLGHAAILVDETYVNGLAAIEAFERDIGLRHAYARDGCVSAAEEMNRPLRGAPMERLAAALMRVSEPVQRRRDCPDIRESR